MKPLSYCIGLLLLCATPALAQDCPAAMPFGPEDRLEDLAERCNVSPADILRANDAQREADLRTAGAVAIPQDQGGDTSGMLDRAGDALRDTAREAGSVAAEAGQAASEYVAGTELGSSVMDDLGISGEATPQLSVSRTSPDAYVLHASGLPAQTPVTIEVWQGDTRSVTQEATVRADGALAVELSPPALESDAPEPLFILEAEEGELRLTATADDP